MLHSFDNKYIFVFALVLSACSGSSDQESVSPAEIAAEQMIQESEDGTVAITPDGDFLAANASYHQFAKRVLETSPLAGPSAVQAARLNSKALDQTLYPQFTPRASVNQDGNPVARLGISQIIYSNGKFQADKQTLRASEIEALGSYLVDANQRVADALLSYAEIDFHRQLAGVAAQLDAKYTGLVGQALRRVNGGVGDQSEVETFQLKQLEAQSDFQDSRANQLQAEAETAALTANLSMPARPPRLTSVPSKSAPPEMVLLYARADAARGKIASERAKRRPSLSLEAFSERDFRTGTTDDGLSLGVGVSVPLGVRNDLEIQAAEAELAGVDAELITSRRDIDRRLAQLRSSIQRDTQQIGVLSELVAAAEARVESFEEKFLSGTVSLEEAVSVLETYKRSKTNLVQTRNDIFAAQVEIARTNGQLVPSATQ